MPTYSTCIFCGQNDSRPSKEDVIPKWIAREFPNVRFQIKDIENERTFGAVSGFGIYSKAPCTRCNNGWLSHLESKVQPVLAPMLHGQSVELRPVDQLLMSRWLIKTAIMFDLRNRHRKPYFTEHECRSLMRALVVPPDTMMFLAVYFGKKGWIFQEHGIEADRDLLPQSLQVWRDVETYSVTFLINNVTLQAFSLRRPKGLQNEQLSVQIASDWSSAETQIWPVANSVVFWPPPSYLDDDLLTDYAERFGTDMAFGPHDTL